MTSTGTGNFPKRLKQLALDKYLLGSFSEWSPVLGLESGASKRIGSLQAGPQLIYNSLAACFKQHGHTVAPLSLDNYPELASSLPSPLLGSALYDREESHSL